MFLMALAEGSGKLWNRPAYTLKSFDLCMHRLWLVLKAFPPPIFFVATAYLQITQVRDLSIL